MVETKDADGTPLKLLFVGKNNLPQIVATVAPGMVLVDRERFTAVAMQILELVEAASKHAA